MARPTIAVLSYHFWRHPRALKIARSLARRGYRVKVWGSRAPFSRGPRILRGVLNYLLALFEVASLKADIYWVENVPDVIYLPLPLLRRRYIYDRRSPWAKQIPVEINVPRLVVKAADAVERYMAKKAIHIVVVSTPMKLEYSFNKPISVIPNYPERNFARKVETTIREKLGIPPTTKIFGFVGKLSRMEGTDLLVDVAAKLAETENSELWIIGDGPLRKIAEMLAKNYDNVRWFGWVERKSLPPYIASLDYGLVPRHRHPYKVFYNHEGIHKIGEYLAYGKPVIASGIAPSPYYITVEPEEFAETVAKVAKDELKPPTPPRNLYWETVSEPELIRTIETVAKHGPA